MPPADPPSLVARGCLSAFVFSLILAIRVWDISSHFWLLGDQIRDWGIALRPFAELPLVGPPTHVDGYTIGPAYYWLMWVIRLVLGPWFDNLPHAGGIGQAIVESAADAVLLLAIWHRTRSVWIALAAVTVIATAAYDVALSAIVWTTVVASALGKFAIAFVLLGWHRDGPWRVAAIAALAWSAVHVYTGAIFVTVGVFAALLADPFARRDWRAVRRTTAVVALVVAALQVPYLLHQGQHRFDDPAMGAVTDGVSRVLAGDAPPEVAKSLAGYAAAFEFIQMEPWTVPAAPWVLLILSLVAAVRYRRDPAIVLLIIVPQATALAGYALFLGALDHYYYIPVIPVAVLGMFLAVAVPSASRAGRMFGVTLLVAAAAIVPARLRFAATLHRWPEYEVLVEASREIARLNEPVRAIRTEFALPATTEPEFLYSILGGRIDPAASRVALIGHDGRVHYVPADD
jgi:hypothetical protein